MYNKLSIAVATLMLAACGSDKVEEPAKEVDYSKLQTTPRSDSALVLADEDVFLQHISNGLRLQTKNGLESRYFGLDGGEIAAPSTGGNGGEGAPSEPSSDAGGYSDTNVHVEGVDEADYVKYDGSHWYIATRPEHEPFLVTQKKPGVKIVATDIRTPSARFVSEYEFDDEWGNIGELYLVTDESSTTHVATMRSQWGDVWPILPGVPFDLAVTGGIAVDFMGAPEPALPPIAAEPTRAAADVAIWPGPQNSKVKIELLDVADPESPAKDWALEVDGSLIQSRKVGNTLYLVTRFDPWLNGLRLEYGDSVVREDNEEALKDISIDKVMPYYRIADSETPLSTDCYLQAETQDHYGLATLVHITAVDLASKKVVGSECLNSNVESMSMSPTALYLTGSYYDSEVGSQNTVIHKFNLDETGVAYAASGKVTGNLGWNSDPVFRMHEYGEQFRIVTTERTGREGPQHSLSILRQNGTTLEAVATLPNAENPEPIGKPNEDIYSVRFEGDRAYIVTFQRTDPLYAIDLSDPENPKVAGELEIPGFATYMHPLGDYLFTLGQDADENGRVKGVKAELISVANDQPEVVETFILGDRGSSSVALNDLRAISFLAINDSHYRVALPITAYTENASGSTQWSYTGMQLFDIVGVRSNALMQNAGVIKVESRSDTQQYPSYGMGRSVLHDDAVFVNFENDVWAANWFSPNMVNGPVADAPVICTQEFRMGLSVTVSLDDTENGATACDAVVTAMDGRYSEVLQARDSDDANQCTFVGAGERPGNYVIETSLKGYRGQDAKVTVFRDECHVIPEEVEMTLEPDDGLTCTAQAVPSIRLELTPVEATFDACEVANVYALHSDGRRYPLEMVGAYGSGSAPEIRDDGVETRPADNYFGCIFEGPYEVPGEMILHVEAEGYESFQQEVFVPEDVCHVHTQDVWAELLPL